MLVLAVAVVPWVLSGCAQLNASPPELQVSPTAGPPGTVLTVSGRAFSAADAADLTVTVGNEPAPVRVAADGSLAVAVPLFLGPSGWPEPPAAPQKVTVHRGTAVVGVTSEGVKVTPLAHAPGTTKDVQASLATIAARFQSLWALAPANLPQELPLRQAAASALAGIASGYDDSLDAVLNGTSSLLNGSTPDVELADAVLASSGASAYLAGLAQALQTASLAQAALTPQATSLCNASGPDFDLACEMQIYVVLDDYTQAFVKPTVTAYNNTIGLTAGLLAIGTVTLPATKIVGALLSVSDFVMEKVAPALFPSHLTQFDLEMTKTTIDVGEVTDSRVVVAAANTPPPITVTDVVKQALTVIGLANGTPPGAFEKALKAAASFDIGLYMNLVSSYESGHPGTFPWADSGVAQMPALTWGPLEVTSDRLVTLYSADESVVQSLSTQLEWLGASLGDADVRVMPRGPGDRSKVLIDNALCLGCSYSGGAFGNDVPASTLKVVVGNVVLTATPVQGVAPLTTTFAWTGLTPQADPYTCVLEFGDGTPAATIADCANTTSQAHTYASTSALANSDGAFHATLSIVGTKKVVAARVPVDWTFTASPTQGTAPFDVTFAWSGFDPASAPLSCTFDPGDGTAAQTVANCGVSGSLTYRYTGAGSFSPGLAVSGGAGTTLKSVPVTSTKTQACVDPSAVAGWQGTIGFSYQGSGAANGTSVGVYRSIDGTVLLDTPALGFPQPLEWTGNLLASQASFTYHDTKTIVDVSGVTHTYSITGDALNLTKSSMSIRFDDASGACTVTMAILVFTDATAVSDGATSSGTTIVADIDLAVPFTTASVVQGNADLPLYTWSGGDYVALDNQLGAMGFSNDLASVLGGPQNMGTATVTWNLTPIAPGP